jgi:hypothetical protein
MTRTDTAQKIDWTQCELIEQVPRQSIGTAHRARHADAA